MQNRELIKNNVKFASKIRKLESKITSLEKELLDKEYNRIPLGHVQDVCLATIDEICDLETSFNAKMTIFKNHAKTGLEAIIDLPIAGMGMASVRGDTPGSVTNGETTNSSPNEKRSRGKIYEDRNNEIFRSAHTDLSQKLPPSTRLVKKAKGYAVILIDQQPVPGNLVVIDEHAQVVPTKGKEEDDWVDIADRALKGTCKTPKGKENHFSNFTEKGIQNKLKTPSRIPLSPRKPN